VKFVCAICLCFLIVVNTLAQVQTATQADTEKIKTRIAKLGVGHKITIHLLNGENHHGAISKIGASDFEIAEVDLKQIVRVYYGEVKKVQGEYGEKNAFGKRPNPKTGIFVLFGVLGGIIAAVALSIPKT